MIVERLVDWATLVRERRKELGLTQADVASEIGMTRQWVSNFESGRATAVAQLHDVIELLAALDLLADLTTSTVRHAV